MNIPTILFEPFDKMPRLSREMLVTEKIDGTNATVYVSEAGEVFAASRSRWITTETDNYGFAAWVAVNKEELCRLGPGVHRGEWWGQGIQRNYGLTEKRFSLFNVSRWEHERPACCHVVPVLYRGPFSTSMADAVLVRVRCDGSSAAPGFMNPEGIVIFHVAANLCFKKMLHKDEQPKSTASVRTDIGLKDFNLPIWWVDDTCRWFPSANPPK